MDTNSLVYLIKMDDFYKDSLKMFQIDLIHQLIDPIDHYLWD